MIRSVSEMHQPIDNGEDPGSSVKCHKQRHARQSVRIGIVTQGWKYDESSLSDLPPRFCNIIVDIVSRQATEKGKQQTKNNKQGERR
jgi:hypothetical protein